MAQNHRDKDYGSKVTFEHLQRLVALHDLILNLNAEMDLDDYSWTAKAAQALDFEIFNIIGNIEMDLGLVTDDS